MTAILDREEEIQADFKSKNSDDQICEFENEVFRRSRVGNNPVNAIDPEGFSTIKDAISGAVDGFKHGWDSGYYKCYAKCMVGPAGSVMAAHLAGFFYGENVAELSAKTYYRFTDKRFVAWGKYSKSLVPKLTAQLAKVIEGGLAGWLAWDAWHCIHECMGCL